MHHRSRQRACRGQATAEFALVLPAVAALLVILLATGHAVITQVRVADAARAAARATVAGHTPDHARDVAIQVAGQGAQVRVASGDGFVEVRVRQGLVGPLGQWGLSVQGTAQVPVEPGQS